MRSRTAVVVAGVGATALLLGAGGTAVAAKMITSADIKNHSIQQRDMAGNSIGSPQLKPNSVGESDLSAKVRGMLGGQQGPQGPKGDPGADGADGADGQDGADGLPGADGQDGADGADGLPGSDGADGADGADGQDGADGVSGFETVTEQPTAAATTLTTGSATCPDGKVAIGGGYSLINGTLNLRGNTVSADGKSWTVTVNNQSANEIMFNVTAICALDN